MALAENLKCTLIDQAVIFAVQLKFMQKRKKKYSEPEDEELTRKAVYLTLTVICM